MRERIKRLRQESIDAVPSVSIERSRIVTEAYQKYDGRMSVPMLRAMVLKDICEKKTLYIGKDELIVGERGPKPKCSPLYPEVCAHTVDDLKVMDSREKTFFKVDSSIYEIQQNEIIPYWEGRSIRGRILDAMDPLWRSCYEAGIFTEFMEQRGPGHTVGDRKLFYRGYREVIEQIDLELAALDYMENPEAYDRAEELRAMRIAAQSVITFARRHAELAEQLAEGEPEETRKQELLTIARVCRRVPEYAPQTVWEAIQGYWFIHLTIITEMNNWDAFSPGRLDQHLYPIYKNELEKVGTTKEDTIELLQCLWCKFNNQPSTPKVGITLKESGTYTDFATINIGGLSEAGGDGVNEMSYILLEVVDSMTLLQPNSNIQLSRKNPEAFIKRGGEIIRKGWGQPPVFNADSVFQELVRQGKSVEDARAGGTSGCVETGAFGKEAYILTGYFNLVKIMELTLYNGFDPRTNCQLGLQTGEVTSFKTFEEFFEAYQKQLKHFIDIKVKGSNQIERMYMQELPVPFLSTAIDDCIANGKDYNAGGARYNSNYIQGVGIGSLTDSMSAIKYHVFDKKTITMEELLGNLKNDFAENEPLRQRLVNKTPKYGNDDDYADDLMKRCFEAYYNEVNGRRAVRGGVYRVNMLPTTCHIYFGEVTGATPDGRRSGMPQSEGISPASGSDRNGPTAVVKSAAKMDHLKTGGTLLNQKFTPSILSGQEGIDNLCHLIRGYFNMDGHHIQFNVIKADTLRKAQQNPEQYRDLIVRVAGYSDYFCDLGKSLQDEIIARTEHEYF